ncbi:hypothetical protein os1_33350 [Comamonadaceae bacterium OS-1]|nr:hypothetical protein os1_33350 [Comamonadaceae bacterium OS-1]
MSIRRGPLLLSICLLACSGGWAASDVPASKDMQIVQRIDDVLVGVDAVSLAIIDRRHVAGSYFLINLHQPSPVAGTAEFVADCQGPLRLATLASSLPSGSIKPETPLLQRRATALDIASLTFNPVHMLDGSWMVAEFACRSSSQPGRARQIAQELLEKGGPPDLRSLWCDLQADGSTQTRRGAEVRFSASDDAVAVQTQWLSSGFVSDTEVVFGSGAQWIVDRQPSRARLLGAGGTLLFTGACSSVPPRP